MAGCRSNTPIEVVSPVPEADQVTVGLLKEAADQAAAAQQELARVQVSRTIPGKLVLDEQSLPEELERKTDFIWSGPAKEAVERVANMIGYQVREGGNPPATVPMVHIRVRSGKVVHILSQIGEQAYPFGEVSLDPNQKIVEFRYRTNSHSMVR
ncbi:DotD/TraH family lipoprotein [Flexibacterium corallicola]|uniref:DotD/TraH family lipoprotein n=1 Tax=Flexibacterium corallicola TaxID=3037259 RepID=UPI00286ED3EB|nr:DotD/TraH family lipoprotein [Pseudovibrio sp. M1P-2-3]